MRAKKPSSKASKEVSSSAHCLLGRNSSKLSAGIVGLANVGKSTFFQAITKSLLGNPNNYPFATIKPEESIFKIPSEKLRSLQQIYKSEKMLPSYLKIVDIAGLVRGASKGEGLGSQFLNDIKTVDGIFQVVRGFESDEITHVEQTVDPVRDLEIVTDELLLKDLETCENAVEKLKKDAKKNGLNSHERSKVLKNITVMEKINDLLIENGKLFNNKNWTEEEVAMINQFNFLTAKPTIYLLNVSKDEYLSQSNKYFDQVSAWIKENSPNDKIVMFSAEYEHELFNGNDKSIELDESSAINKIITEMKDSLNLISFYTCGPKEAREWNVKRFSTAPEGAGLIHTDLQKNFVNVSVWKYDELVKIKDQINSVDDVNKLLKSGKHGKDYVLEDGDIILIKAVGSKTR